MACTLTIGRAEQCKDSVGGLLAVYAIPFNSVSYWRGGGAVQGRDDNDNKVDFLGIKTELHGNNTLDSEIVSSRNEGTTYERQTLVLNLNGADAELYRMLRNTSDRYYFAVQTRGLPNELRLVGTNQNNTIEAAKVSAKGAEISQIQTVSGASLGDRVGVTVTITSEVSCGELDTADGYARIDDSRMVSFDRKLVGTYESITLDSTISSTSTSTILYGVASVVDGTYYSPATGEAMVVTQVSTNGINTTVGLVRGALGTEASRMQASPLPFEGANVIHKIS